MRLTVDITDTGQITATVEGWRDQPAPVLARHLTDAVLTALGRRQGLPEQAGGGVMDEPVTAPRELPASALAALAPEQPARAAADLSRPTAAPSRSPGRRECERALSEHPDCIGVARAGGVATAGMWVPAGADQDDLRRAAYAMFDRDRTVAQVAALLGVERDTVRSWRLEARRP